MAYLWLILIPLNLLGIAIHTYKRRLKLMYGPILYAGGQMLIALSTLF